MEVDKGDHEKRNSSSEKKKTRQNVEKQRQKWREQKKVQSEKDGRKEILRQRNKEYRKRMKIEEEINEQRFLDVQSQLTKFKRENENLKSFVKEYMQKKTDDRSDDEDVFSNEEIQIEKNWREKFFGRS